MSRVAGGSTISHAGMERKPVTKKQKEVLAQYWGNGMSSKGKACSAPHLKASQETGLTIPVVKVRL